MRHLEEHLTEDISLSQLAALTRLSESRFARAFKSSTGLPPYTWLLKKRIDKAKDLIVNDNEPLSSPAIQLGFADQSHFGRSFRRFAGLTLRAWKQAMTADQEHPFPTKKEGRERAFYDFTSMQRLTDDSSVVISLRTVRSSAVRDTSTPEMSRHILIVSLPVQRL